MDEAEQRELRERVEVMSAAIGRLIRRVDALEAKLGLEAAARPAVPPPPLEAAGPARPEEPEAQPEGVEERAAAGRAEAGPPVRLESAVGLTWLNRIGVITLVLGAGFLFKYAVDSRWIGPAGRVAGGVAAGAAALGAGEALWRRRQRIFAQGITALGLGLLYLAFYAAYGFYRLAPVGISFVAMALTTVLGAWLAAHYGAAALFGLAEAGGYLTPVVLSTGQDAPWVVFPYLLLLNAGAVWLGRRKGWRFPEYVALAASTLLYAAWHAGHFAEEKRAPAAFFILGAYALFVMSASGWVARGAQFAAAASLGIVFTRDARFCMGLLLALGAAGLMRGMPVPVVAGFWTGFAAQHAALPHHAEAALRLGGAAAGFVLNFGWLVRRLRAGAGAMDKTALVLMAVNGVAFCAAGLALLEPEAHAWTGLFLVGEAAAFAWGGYVLRAGGVADAALLAALLAVSFLTLAAPVQLSAWRITAAWITEASALALIARRAGAPRLYRLSTIVLILAAARLLTADAPLKVDALFVNPRFLVMAWAAAGYWFCASCYRRGAEALAIYAAGHLTLAGALELDILDAIWRNAAPAEAHSYAIAGFSVLLAAYGVVLVAAGIYRRFQPDRVLGLGALLLVVAKLYLYDVWALGRLFRTSAFVALGVLLVAASYLYSRYRGRLADFLR